MTTPRIPTAAPTPAEARSALENADRLSRSAHEAARWPYISFLLALGVATSFGTLAMGLTTGDAFGLSYVAVIAVTFVLIAFFMRSIHDHAAFARSRRWTAYIVAWVITYAAAIGVVAFVHGSVLWSGITSGLILLTSVACAAWEARS